MPVSEPIQVAFNGGEVTPRLHGRVDLELLRRALGLMRNWEPTAGGSMLLRQGSRIGAAIYESVRTTALPMAGHHGYVFNWRDDEVDIRWADGLVEWAGDYLAEGGSPEQIVDGHMDDENVNWPDDYDPNPDYGWYTATPENRNSWVAGGIQLGYAGYVRQAITIKEHELGGLPAVTHRLRFTFMGMLAPQNSYLRIRIGTTEGGVEVDEFHVVKENNDSPWTYEHDYFFDVEVPADTSTIHIEFALINSTGSLSDVYNDYVRFGYVSLLNPLGMVTVAHSLTEEEVLEAQIEVMPDRPAFVLVHPKHPPAILELGHANEWTYGAISFTDEPSAWTPDNYPSVVAFFQGRMWLGASPEEPSTWWGSKSGSPFDFGVSDPVVASDAVAWSLATRGVIRWMRGRNFTMMIGSDIGEHAVTAQAGAIAIDDIQLGDVGEFGAAQAQSSAVGGQVSFLTRDRRRIRTLEYSQEREAWDAPELTVLGEHLLRTGIREVVWAKNPSDMLLCVMQDPELPVAACVLNRSQQLSAWWRLELGGEGQVLSATITEGPDGSTVWLLVKRDNGNNGFDYTLEYLLFGEAGEPAYLDVARVYPDVAAGTDVELAGLSHREGQTLRVVGTGIPDGYADLEVTGGLVTVPKVTEQCDIAVGELYASRADTLIPEAGGVRGTSQGMKKRYARVFARLNESALPKINGERVKHRNAGAVPLVAADEYTGDTLVHPLGWDAQGVLTIEQDLPYRTEVLSIFGALAGNEV